MENIFCISFSCIEDFNKSTLLITKNCCMVDYDNYILEFDTKEEIKKFLILLDKKEIERDVFESEKLSII